MASTAPNAPSSKSTTKWPRQSEPESHTKPASTHRLQTRNAAIRQEGNPMLKNNKWTHGKGKFVLPPLRKEDLGLVGCRFHEGNFDPSVGPEFFLTIFDNHENSEALAKLGSFRLFCKGGMVRTDHGIIVFLLFSIYDQSEYDSSYELFLNPYEMETICLLSSLGQQTHLKVILYDSEEDHTRSMIEFENVYDFSDIAGKIVQLIGHEKPGDFQKAQQELMTLYTIEDLLKL